VITALNAVEALVGGAIVLLLAVRVVAPRPMLASAIGLVSVVIAAGLGLMLPAPLSLAVLALCAVTGLALLLLPGLDAELPAQVAEAAALLLLGTGGAIALASATDLLWAIVGLETLALAAVVLVALSAGDRPLEAAFKYFVLGAISLAGLLYGLGLVFLGTGSFSFPTQAQVAADPLVLAGVILIGLGLAFELAMFPFHWGGLDAYTSASPALAGYVMSASKLAAAFALGRLVTSASVDVSQLLIWVGCATIVWGTFGALAQARDLRRMLGYSAITHAGFIGLALGSGPDGPTTAVFYAAVYGSMAMLVFASLTGDRTVDLRGLGRLRALGLTVGLLSLSGIPPLPGFWAKLAVLVVAWQAAGPIPTLIAVFGGVFSVLYYLRPLPDLLAALRGETPRPQPALVPGLTLALLAVCVLAVFPGLIWALARG
jgi:NADH-quinone oxidoreductase subunit N